MKKLKELVLEGVVLAVLGVGCYGFVKGVIDQGRFERTRRKVQLLIDSDKNRVITNNEWNVVYNQLGKKPTNVRYGLDLSTDELNSYLSRHSKN